MAGSDTAVAAGNLALTVLFDSVAHCLARIKLGSLRLSLQGISLMFKGLLPNILLEKSLRTGKTSSLCSHLHFASLVLQPKWKCPCLTEEPRHPRCQHLTVSQASLTQGYP